MKAVKETKEEKFEIDPFKGLDYDVYELVRNFSREDILSVRLDIEISIGQNQKYFSYDFL